MERVGPARRRGRFSLRSDTLLPDSWLPLRMLTVSGKPAVLPQLESPARCPLRRRHVTWPAGPLAALRATLRGGWSHRNTMVSED